MEEVSWVRLGLLEKTEGTEGPFSFRKVRARRAKKKVLMMVRVKCTLGEHRQGIDLPHNNYDLLILIRVSTKTKWI